MKKEVYVLVEDCYYDEPGEIMGIYLNKIDANREKRMAFYRYAQLLNKSLKKVEEEQPYYINKHPFYIRF